MSTIRITDGQPYFNAVSAITTRTGAWLSLSEGLTRIAWDFDWNLGGAGKIDGSIHFEYTAQLFGTMPTTGTRVVMPVGSLHTNLGAACTLAATGMNIVLNQLPTSRFAVMYGDVPPGSLRMIYTYAASGGAAPNTLSVWCSGA
jgi:hypothetical protein